MVRQTLADLEAAAAAAGVGIAGVQRSHGLLSVRLTVVVTGEVAALDHMAGWMRSYGWSHLDGPVPAGA